MTSHPRSPFHPLRCARPTDLTRLAKFPAFLLTRSSCRARSCKRRCQSCSPPLNSKRRRNVSSAWKALIRPIRGCPRSAHVAKTRPTSTSPVSTSGWNKVASVLRVGPKSPGKSFDGVGSAEYHSGSFSTLLLVDFMNDRGQGNDNRWIHCCG
jgi:hypothetical protein